MINNVFSERKMERRKSDIDVNDDSWEIIRWAWLSSKSKPIWMIGNGFECSPWWFLGEYDIEALIDFKNGIDEEVILLNILWEYL